MERRRPSIFIGSSTEGLEIAKAIQTNLDDTAETTLWSQGVFGLSEGTLESLVVRTQDFDFAILILTPDDLIETRTKRTPSPRDNVLLELGLCLGALGRERTFVVYDRTAGLKLPTDLAGVTAATFQPHTTQNWQAALGAACTRIEDAIKKLGARLRPAGTSIEPCMVEMYFHKHGFTKTHANRFAQELGALGMRCIVRQHDSSAVPDAIFIGCLVTAAEARAILGIVPYDIKYLFRTDYPESDGGDMTGRKIGLGYWSNYNSNLESAFRISKKQLRQLLAKNLTNAEFQRLVHRMTMQAA